MKKAKPYLLRLLKVACLFLAVLFVVGVLQEYVLCRNDQNRMRMRGYYLEERNSLDMVIIGASDVYTGFSSAYAYKNYGFTSFPYATESATAGACKTQLKEVLRTQKPKMIVVEINAFLYTENNENDDAHVRKFIDNVPLNGNKIEFVNQNLATADQIEYYLPIVKYHGNWNDYPSGTTGLITSVQQDLRGGSLLKGYRTVTKQYKTKQKILNEKLASEEERVDLAPLLEDKLRDMLDFCKSEKLENIIFIRMPHIVYDKTYKRAKKANTAGDIIKSYGYDFYNFERESLDIGIDPKADFYNFDHLNIYGSQKFTDCLSKLLIDKYNLGKSELNDEQKKDWENAVKYYDMLYGYADNAIKVEKKKYTLGENYKTIKKIEDFSAKK